MKIISIFSRAAVLGLLMSVGVSLASAQGYYDDDIYYDASKAKKEQRFEKAKKQSQKASQQASYYYDGAQYVPWDNVGDYHAADTYQVTGTSTRDVDEYNRHSPAQQKETTDSITLQQFEAISMSNTRNLARFHGSEEAQAAYAESPGADTYVHDAASSGGYYTSPQSTTVVNLNLVGGYGYPYYGSSWYWNRWGYGSYWGYDPYWGPSWSYYYGPSWSWGWGWSRPGWGWCGPSWSWGCGGPHPGWHHPGWYPVRPNYTSAGAYAPNTTNRGSGTYRGGTAGRYGNVSGNRPSASGSLGTRPSYGGGTVNRGTSAGTSRPGYRVPTNNPNGTGSSGVTRGRTPNSSYGTSNGNSTRQRSNSYNSNVNSNPNSNRNSYNYNGNSYNSSRGRFGSSGSFGSGGSRSGGYSGGGASRGGGGHRGR